MKGKKEITLEEADKIAASIPCPQEDCWGFAGTLKSNSGRDDYGSYKFDDEKTTRLWEAACTAVAITFAEENKDVIKNFLRSRWGRHLADEAVMYGGSPEDETHLLDGTLTAITRTKTIRNRTTGKIREVLVWQKAFEEIRKATLSGEWQE